MIWRYRPFGSSTWQSGHNVARRIFELGLVVVRELLQLSRSWLGRTCRHGACGNIGPARRGMRPARWVSSADQHSGDRGSLVCCAQPAGVRLSRGMRIAATTGISVACCPHLNPASGLDGPSAIRIDAHLLDAFAVDRLERTQSFMSSPNASGAGQFRRGQSLRHQGTNISAHDYGEQCRR